MKRNGPSFALTEKQGSAIISAALHALAAGCPLNRAITIHLGALTACSAQAFTTLFFKKYGDWVRKRTSFQPNYVWVLENAGAHGLHLHAAIHIPDAVAGSLRARALDWVSSCSARQCSRRGDLNIQKIDSSDSPRSSGYLGDFGRGGVRCGLKGWVGYMLKGVGPAAAAQLGITSSLQGSIKNKRCGFSQSLGATRRRRTKFILAVCMCQNQPELIRSRNTWIRRANCQ